MSAQSSVCPHCGQHAVAERFCGHCGGRLGADAERDPLIGTTIGAYRIESMVGAGGMGRVYLAVHPTIGSRVAIKVLTPACAENPDLVERFFAEARAVNLIHHECIVNVLDLAHLPDGRPYIVMEYLDGAPLSSLIDKRGQLPLGSLARLMIEVLSALAAAHARGIVHRDLKPDNIYVSPQGRAKVLDFGIAKLQPDLQGNATPTQTGALLGTPQYMSPEQAQAKRVDSRCDIYSAALILFECVAGHPPYTGNSLLELLNLQVSAPLPALQELRPELPEEYEAVIRKAAEKDPQERFQSAEEFLEALSQCSASLPMDSWQPLSVDTSTSSAKLAAMATPPATAAPDLAPFIPTAAASPTASREPGPNETSAPGRTHQRKKLSLTVIAVAVLLAAALITTVLTALRSQFASNEHARSPELPAVAESQLTPENFNDGSLDSRHRVLEVDDAAPSTSPRDATTKDVEKNTASASPSPRAIPRTKPRKPKSSSPMPVPTSSDSPKHRRQIDVEQRPVALPSPSRQPELPARISIDAIRYDHFDVSGYMPKAQRIAKRLFNDAVFFRLDADGVLASGHANLELQSDFSVTYRFFSPSRAKRPASLPLGIEHKPRCLIYVNISPNGSSAYVLDGWKCDDRRQPFPQCSIKDVWQWAIETRRVPPNAVASISYYSSGKTARYSFSIDDTKHSYWVPGDCRDR